MNVKRSSGILMPISSLPSPYGIGSLGKSAYAFVDFLKAAGQSWWQILPVGPLSYGDSPYQSLSTFAGNPYFIDLDLLVANGILLPEDLEGYSWGDDPETVDYGRIYENRFKILAKAAERGLPMDLVKVKLFAEVNRDWIQDYALFMACKRHFNMLPWTEWPDEEIRMHKPEACARYREMLIDDVHLFIYIQYLFFQQWKALRVYAADHGIGIIGDLPIYVAMDSADVWSEPHWFQLDERNVPTEVSGVPPDVFNADGQLWGNPLYRWTDMEKDGFSWWIRRLKGSFFLYDILRIDHFRGLESYWAVPNGAETAMSGRWVKGPGSAFIQTIKREFPTQGIIAEDLGYLTEEVKQLLAESGFPGMRLLQMGFEDGGDPYYMPHNYTPDSICYVGTHDNASILKWLEDSDEATVTLAREYLSLTEEEGYRQGFLRAGLSSVSRVFIGQIQDYLGLSGRINQPGMPSGNWVWRAKPDAFSSELAEEIYRMTARYERI